VTSSKSHKYILVGIDTSTHYADCVPLKTLTAKETCQALLTLFHKYGICRKFISDNGTNFTSQVTKSFLKCLGITVRNITPLRLASNGPAERCIQTVVNYCIHD